MLRSRIVNYIKMVFISGISIFRQIRWPVKILLLIVFISFFAGGSVVITGKSSFCNSCHIMNPYYDSWKSSKHSNVNCIDCHLQPGFSSYVKGKINGFAQAVDCMVGRISTKPSATVEDSSCLRSECHSVEELESTNIDYNGIKFTHRNHVKKVVDGIKISCGTCHSHFEGDEHFKVNNDACFTCHFLRDSETDSPLVNTRCQDCHHVPDKVIKRGFVAINHAEFVSYKASCEDSCHKKEIQKTIEVVDSVCLNCHSFSKGQQTDSVELHEAHTSSEKVECYACHGKVSHGQTEVMSVSVMMDCQSCHSDTHEVQQTIYTTKHPMQDEKTERVLNPMFLTHVECTGCHIEPVQKKTGILDSLGKVAKAVPRACDKCHEEGTGQRYIPFWQGKIKALYDKISLKLDNLEEQVRLETNEELAKKLYNKVEQCRLILESVSSDGSWGVHNFKYTEAMLLRANEIIDR